MASKFKVGDKVMIRRDAENPLSKTRMYTITDICGGDFQSYNIVSFKETGGSAFECDLVEIDPVVQEYQAK